MTQLITRINQGKYDTEKELINLRNNALRFKCKSLLRAVNKRMRKCFPKVFQKIIEGSSKKNKTKNKQKKPVNMSSVEKKRYLNKFFGPDGYGYYRGDDIFDRGIVVSGGGFGVGKGKK